MGIGFIKKKGNFKMCFTFNVRFYVPVGYACVS